jgi:transcription elongation factor Elf1
LKPGDSFDCPHCGKDSFLKKESVMDGWTMKGQILVCAACSTKIADIPDKAEEASSDKTSEIKKSKLAAFLDTEETAPQRLEATEEETHFCRDCKYFIAHPFTDKCSLFDKSVNPMDDCNEFIKKS